MRAIKIVFLPLLVFFTSCNSLPESNPYMFSAGFTQGTTYHITYECPTKDSVDLTDDIDALLKEFDMSLSTYIDNSIISKINRNVLGTRTDKYFDVVFNESKRINELTGGAFDITVGPLINAWGFGSGMKLEMSKNVIDSLLQFVGMEKVSLDNGVISKASPEIYLDVNAIAQGYSVDIVCDFFKKLKIENFMVEIGGEIRSFGVSPRGAAWRIGIDKPYYGNQRPGDELQGIVALSNKSLASSGNYRKYYEVDGKKIVHTLDPHTGYTKMSELLSVTIITDNCITADGLSTSCMVMGLEKAKVFIEGLEGVEAYFIFTDDDGLYLEWSTEGMKELLLK